MRKCSGDWKMEQLKGRIIYKGKAEGKALVTTMPISFYGGVDPNTGVVMEKGHELNGVSIKGKVLVFPQGKGSTVGSYTLYRLKKNGVAPAAMINKETETIVAVGAIISEIPFVDKVDVSKFKTGNKVSVENDTVTISYPP
jgi:phosphomecalonate degydratase small subunit